MRRYLILICALISLGIISCCPVTSMHSLAKPDEGVVFDGRLAGAWQGGSSDRDTGFFHFSKGPDGQMRILALEHKDDHTLEQYDFPVTVNRIDLLDYMTITLETLKMKDAQKYKGYVIVRYEIKEKDTLIFSDMDEEVLARAIEAGKIKGEITYEENGKKAKKVDCVRITDTTENLRIFLTGETSKVLFRPYMTLKRITP